MYNEATPKNETLEVTMSNELLRVEHVTKSYGKNVANRDISFTVNAGETAVLRGIEISPQNFELLTAEQINEAAPGYLETQSVRGEDIRLLLVAVHLKNTSQEEILTLAAKYE